MLAGADDATLTAAVKSSPTKPSEDCCQAAQRFNKIVNYSQMTHRQDCRTGCLIAASLLQFIKAHPGAQTALHLQTPPCGCDSALKAVAAGLGIQGDGLLVRAEI